MANDLLTDLRIGRVGYTPREPTLWMPLPPLPALDAARKQESRDERG